MTKKNDPIYLQFLVWDYGFILTEDLWILTAFLYAIEVLLCLMLQGGLTFPS